jgi:hypothetical protein
MMQVALACALLVTAVTAQVVAEPALHIDPGVLAAARNMVWNTPDPQLIQSMQGWGQPIQATEVFRLGFPTPTQDPTVAPGPTGPDADVSAGTSGAFTVPTPALQILLPDANSGDAQAKPMPETLPAEPMPEAVAGQGGADPTPEILPVIMPILEDAKAPATSLSTAGVPEYMRASIAERGMPKQFGVNLEDLTPAKQAAVLTMKQAGATAAWLENYKGMLMWGDDTLLSAVMNDR